MKNAAVSRYPTRGAENIRTLLTSFVTTTFILSPFQPERQKTAQMLDLLVGEFERDQARVSFHCSVYLGSSVSIFLSGFFSFFFPFRLRRFVYVQPGARALCLLSLCIAWASTW